MLPNWVLLGIQPIECLRMEVTVKEPGLEMNTRVTSLDAGFETKTSSRRMPTRIYYSM